MPTTDPPTVSVIMPVYNAGRYLDRAIKSVFAQTYRDWELVIVDDGSTQSATRQQLDAVAAHPNVTVHHQTNRGPAHARNFAIAEARGRYICPLDADDWLHPRFLQETAKALDNGPAFAIAHTWVRKVGAHTGVWRTGPFDLPVLLGRCTLHVTALYRRPVWMAVGGYDAQFKESAEDWDFWISAAARGYHACEVPETLAYYRRSASGREYRARDPEVAAKLMRSLVAKHRPLYQQHLDAILADVYAERASTARLLDRFYQLPGIRLAVKAREVLRQARLL